MFGRRGNEGFGKSGGPAGHPPQAAPTPAPLERAAAPVAAEPSRRVAFYGKMFDRAIARGELRPEAAAQLHDVIRTINAGLVFAASNDVEAQARTVEAIKALLSGALLQKGSNGPT